MDSHNLGIEGIQPHDFYIRTAYHEEINHYTFELWGTFTCGEMLFSINEDTICIIEDIETLEAINAELFQKAYISALRFHTVFCDICNIMANLMNYEAESAEDMVSWFLSKPRYELQRYSMYCQFLRRYVTDYNETEHYWSHAFRAFEKYASWENPQPGYIYLLRAVTPDNHYKIGLSKDPVKRIESMGVKLPFPIEPLHQFPTNHRFKAEKNLHEKYADKRVNGEWFNLSDADVQEICAIGRMNVEGVRVS